MLELLTFFFISFLITRAFYWWLQHINGIAQIKQAIFGEVDMNFVLGVGGYDLDRFAFSSYI